MHRVVEEVDGELDPNDVAWLESRLGWPRFLNGDFAGGMATTESAIDRFRELDESVGLAVSLSNRAQMALFVQNADTDTASEWYRSAVVQARRTGNPQTVGWVLAETAQALIFADRVDEHVEEMLDEAQPALEAAGDLVGVAHVCMDRTIAAWAQDDIDTADRWARRGIEYSRAAGHAVYEQALLIAVGVGWLYRGDPARSRGTLEQAVRLAYDTHNLFQLGISLLAQAARAAVVGRAEDAALLWGAATALAPAWPVFKRRYYDELMGPARASLGARWDEAVAAGATLTVDEALELALV